MAQGNYGTKSSPLADLYSEQIQLTPRTSDPTSPTQGDWWLRTDLASGDKIATLRWQNAAGTQSIPVFPTTQDPDDPAYIEKVVRVQTPNGLGWVPILDGDWAAFNELGFQHAGARYGYHDSPSAVPDSDELQARYDATKLSLSDGNAVSNWPDESGNNRDLDEGTAPTYKTGVINNNPIVRYDGTGDNLRASWTAVSQPYNLYFAGKFTSVATDTNEYALAGYDGDSQFGIYSDQDGDGSWRYRAPTEVDSGTAADTDTHVVSALFDGASSTLRLDGAQIANGNTGAESMNGLTTGAVWTGVGSYGAVDFGEILVYPSDKSGIQGDVESYLADKWGVTL